MKLQEQVGEGAQGREARLPGLPTAPWQGGLRVPSVISGRL